MFKKRIDDAIALLIKSQVTPWAFLSSGRPMRVKAYDGTQIAYEGVGFEGSPQLVFWSRYIEPFLEELATREISAAVSEAQKRGVDAKLLLPEVQILLSAGFAKVYQSMSEIDQRLRGQGNPKSVQPKSIDGELGAMTGFVDEHIRAELDMWVPKSPIEYWYERNKFWVWVIGILVSGTIGVLTIIF